MVEPKRRPGRPAVYNWDEILAPLQPNEKRRLSKGVAFKISTDSMQAMVMSEARKRGLRFKSYTNPIGDVVLLGVGPERHNGYPWDEWLDGQRRVLTRGIDFTVAPGSLRQQALNMAGRRGVGISTFVKGNTVVIRERGWQPPFFAARDWENDQMSQYVDWCDEQERLALRSNALVQA